jgi:rhamnosyltransferase
MLAFPISPGEMLASSRRHRDLLLVGSLVVPAPSGTVALSAGGVAAADRYYRCTVVIPTKDGGWMFEEALAALQRQTIWADTELIVVDSGSSDGTVWAARAAGARVIEIPPDEFNHGATRDFGISLASADIVILLVQDALPQDVGLLAAMVKAFDDSEVAGVYARQIPRPDADLLTKRNLAGWLTGRQERENRKMQSVEWYQALSPMEKYLFCNFDNVCSGLRKPVWTEHRFGRINFGEDIDWAERVLKAGWRIVYEPAAAVVHSHDRPLSYEYKRTYVCHRKLYQQFGLQLVPSLVGIHRAWAYSTLQDARYIAAQRARFADKLKLWAKVPVLNLFSAVAQYRAARDEAAGHQRQVAGV